MVSSTLFVDFKSRNRLPYADGTGPVVRINPHELHIDDPEYWEVIYSTSSSFDKMKSTQYRFGAPHATFSTPEHDIHKPQRAALLGHIFEAQNLPIRSLYPESRGQNLCSARKGICRHGQSLTPE